MKWQALSLSRRWTCGGTKSQTFCFEAPGVCEQLYRAIELASGRDLKIQGGSLVTTLQRSPGEKRKGPWVADC